MVEHEVLTLCYGYFYGGKEILQKMLFHLEPGVYVFPHTSVSGKTYLARTLGKYRRHGEPVRA